MMNSCFEMVDLRPAGSHVIEGTIVRKPHHCNFPTCQGGNQSWITETVIGSATTTPWDTDF